MAETKIKFTYEDYKSLPESETKRYELLEGELVMVPSPTTYHQRVSRNLEFLLWEFVQRSNLGEILHAPLDVVLSKEDVVQPDILYISKERHDLITRENIRGAPDLVIEILSPATAERDRIYKRTLYARHGVREYWIADPDAKTIEVLALAEAGFKSIKTYSEEEILTSSLLKGLTIKVLEVFQSV